MKNYCILLFLACFIFISPLSAKAFHLLILGDTEEPYIKYGVMKNIQNIEEVFSYLSMVSRISLNSEKLICTKRNLTRTHILEWVKKEVVAPDDVIILYYSGHGIRTYESPTIWPSACSSSDGKDIEFSEIMEKLFLKKAALYLVLLDCCNQLIEPKGVPRDGTPPNNYITFDLKKLNEKRLITSCHELFFKSYGIIIASAASPDEVGFIDSKNKEFNRRGGIFSKVFLNYFLQELDSQHPQWQNIFKKTKRECLEETKKEKYTIIHSPLRHDYQTPQYKIFLHKRRRSSRVYREYLLKHCKWDSKSFPEILADTIKQNQGENILELDSDVVEEGDLVVQ